MARLIDMSREFILVSFLLILTGPTVSSVRGESQPAQTETVGIGVPDPSITNETQRRATACNAAMVQAQARMLVILRNRSGNDASNDAQLKAGILQGAAVVKREWIQNGDCRITLRLDKSF
jgi:hypothetical protein